MSTAGCGQLPSVSLRNSSGAGFYTYDIADNAGYPSADHMLAEYQHFAVGDWAFNMNSMFGIELPINESDAFKVRAFEPNQWLLWAKPDSTWSWLLKPLADSRTRLILRIRAHPVNLFWTLFMEFGDPPMARRMLKGIKARAERMGAGGRSEMTRVWSDATSQISAQ